ncbi:nucleotide exchange factor GrpE [candidate division WOR-3 bacterium]|nr:nucleotide exchange factor GrpE [candidate division WOR-3 bacterium]
MAKRKTLKQELEEYKDNYLRALAEFENYKKRVRKDREVLINYANERLILEFIPVLDNFERGIGNCKLQIVKCKMKDKKLFKSFYEGIKLIYSSFKKTLENEGLKSFNSINEKFDPRFHEAISVAESDCQVSDTVISEISKGYIFKDRVIRPAQVVVSKKAESKIKKHRKTN